MKKIMILFVIILILSSSMGVIEQAHATIFKLTDNDVDDSYPSLYENKIAWNRYSDVSHGTSIGVFYWDGSNTTQVSTSGVTPSYNDGVISWTAWDGSDHEIYYWDGININQVTYNNNQDMQVTQFGGNIAWAQWSQTWNDPHIMYWNGNTTIQISSDEAWEAREPSLYGGAVAWQQRTVPTDKFEIYLWDGDNIINITHDSVLNNIYPSLYDGAIAWVAGNSIMYWDGTTIDNIYTHTSMPWNPVLYDGTIAWGASDGSDSEIFYWDGSSVIQITDNSWNDCYPSLYDGTIAWAGQDGLDEEIFFWDGGSLEPQYFNPSPHNTVPEPTTLFLFGFGLLGLAGLRKRF